MKKGILIAILSTFFLQINGQDKYFVEFVDKKGTPYTLENPMEFLALKSIERRIKQRISISEIDLPVSPTYIHNLKSTGAKVLYSLKWFNGAVVELNNPEVLNEINNLSFVASTKKIFDSSAKKTATPEEEIYPIYKSKKDQKDYYSYGSSTNQIKMLNGHSLHNMGFRGQGITIAVLDGGFYKADILPAFDSLWVNNRIVHTHDFVNPHSNIYQEHSHGMLVLSVMASNIPEQIVGAAPEANYVLIRCEDTSSEQIIEEYNWAAAAELADSLGVDIINSSLGYYDYDATWQSHSYANMDGNTTPIAKAANIAAEKGMLVVASAGNEATNSWKYIITPADAMGSIAVGAVNATGAYVNFSSIGPSADGRVKPDVAAQGFRTAVQATNGNIGTADGTSLSAPIISGLAACLWQAMPSLTAQELRGKIIQSADLYSNPNYLKGYGIPNFLVAMDSLPQSVKRDRLVIFPNPSQNRVKIKLPLPINTQYSVLLATASGVVVHFEESKSISLEHTIQLPNSLPSGIYLVQLTSHYGTSVGRLMKN